MIMLLFGLFAIFNSAVATVTWTKPSGTGDCGTVAEGTTGALSITLTGTPSTVGSFAILTQHPGVTLGIDTSTGVISQTAGALDYEAGSTITFVVTAVDSADHKPGTATCTVTLTDVNDNKPVFTKAIATVNTDDNVAAGTIVTSAFTATDADKTPANNVITAYSITGGNTNTDFEVVKGTGVIKVATGKTLVQSATASYTLTITAVDSGTTAMTGTGTLTVCVGCSAAAAIAASVLTLMAVLLASLI